MCQTPLFLPPSSDGGCGELRRVVRRADNDVAGVPPHIIDAKRCRDALSLACKIVAIDLGRFPAPRPALTLKSADEFLLLCVHTDDGQTSPEECPPLGSHVLELLVPLRRILGEPLPGLDIFPHRESHSPQQGPYGLVTDSEPPPTQLFSDLPHTAPHPLTVVLRISRHLVTKQLFHRSGNAGVLLFHTRPSLPGLPLLLNTLTLKEISKLTSPTCYCRPADAGNLHNCADATSPEVVRLDGRVQPALLVAQPR